MEMERRPLGLGLIGVGRALATDCKDIVEPFPFPFPLEVTCSAEWERSSLRGSSRHRSTSRVVVAWTSRRCAFEMRDRRTSLIWGRL